jgi:prepilin-type N-terminal cleavage/methylation domain-containing protein
MRRRGFTMTELLVVIAIIVVLLGLVSPMVARAWKTGQRTRTAADLQAIAAALEAYRQDHGDYPEIGIPPRPVPYQDFNGARWLCQALVAPRPAAPTSTADGDGADGPGFRTRGMSGKVWGPYIRPEQFKLGNPSRGPSADDPTGYLTLFDKNNKPILYYRAVGKPNIRMNRGYVGTNPPNKAMWNTYDNMDSSNRGGMRFDQLAMMLGDTNTNGGIDPGETPAHEGPYLLWSAGPDEVFGPDASLGSSTDPAKVRKAVERSDDITNFKQ